jgi:hypothetical protein
MNTHGTLRFATAMLGLALLVQPATFVTSALVTGGFYISQTTSDGHHLCEGPPEQACVARTILAGLALSAATGILGVAGALSRRSAILWGASAGWTFILTSAAFELFRSGTSGWGNQQLLVSAGIFALLLSGLAASAATARAERLHAQRITPV